MGSFPHLRVLLLLPEARPLRPVCVLAVLIHAIGSPASAFHQLFPAALCRCSAVVATGGCCFVGTLASLSCRPVRGCVVRCRQADVRVEGGLSLRFRNMLINKQPPCALNHSNRFEPFQRFAQTAQQEQQIHMQSNLAGKGRQITSDPALGTCPNGHQATEVACRGYAPQSQQAAAEQRYQMRRLLGRSRHGPPPRARARRCPAPPPA